MSTDASTRKTALIVAGGTGGHIFPGLAVAHALREQGWDVYWLGGPDSMESRIVPTQEFAFESIAFGGVRGKGMAALLGMPWRLLKAIAQSRAVLQRVRPQVVIGMGGYITAPAGLAAASLGIPLVLHEQNSVAGMANRWLKPFAKRVFTAYPNVLGATEQAAENRDGKVQWVGNPLRASFLQQPTPEERMQERTGALRLLVVGGSLGARALNEIVPQAIALMPADQRPTVVHQSGAAQIDALRANYAAAGVEAELTPFIDDTASAFAAADIIVCRAGASTVTEIAAVGAASIFVPFPSAVDDHQTTNAQFLVNAGGGWLVQQRDLTPQGLSEMLLKLERSTLVDVALKAKNMQKINATREVVTACEELA